MNNRETQFSPDGKHRLILWRDWDMTNKAYVQFIGLNPSTANETENDPTIRRCIDFAKRWGYGAMCMTNLFTMVSPYPDDLDKCEAAVLPENPKLIVSTARGAGHIIAAWGNFKVAAGAAKCCRALFEQNGLHLHHLGLNDNGTPKHPLYLAKTKIPILWT